jgi:hypothetical protein
MPPPLLLQVSPWPPTPVSGMPSRSVTVPVCMCMCVYMCVGRVVSVCICMCVYAFVCVCMYMYMCGWGVCVWVGGGGTPTSRACRLLLVVASVAHIARGIAGVAAGRRPAGGQARGFSGAACGRDGPRPRQRPRPLRRPPWVGTHARHRRTAAATRLVAGVGPGCVQRCFRQRRLVARVLGCVRHAPVHQPAAARGGDVFPLPFPAHSMHTNMGTLG